jgi:hypothetical protein
MTKMEGKIMWRLGLLSLLLVAVMTLKSCDNVFDKDEYDIDKVKASPSFTLPLAYGDLVVEDLLSKTDQGNIRVDADGLVSLVYTKTLKVQGVQDLLVFPSRNFDFNVALASGPLPQRTTETSSAPDTRTIDFNFSPEKLTEVKFKTTSIKVTLSFTPATPASNVFDVQIRLPSFQLNNTPFQGRITPSASGTTFPLQDYVAILNDNSFSMDIILIEKAHPAEIITNPTSANIKIEFNNIDFKYVKGFFGDQSMADTPEETIEFGAFGEAWTKAKVSFANPKFSFSVNNEYGIPTRVTFNPIEGLKNNGATLPVTLNPSSPIAVNIPSQLGQSANTEVVITNARQLIDFVPDKFRYKVSARINQGLTTGNNFCADDSKISVDFKAEIPLYGRASDILLADTVSLDLSDINNSDIESAALKARVENQLPLGASLQLYLANEQSAIFDSLFITQPSLIKASTVNASGELQTAGLFDQEVPITKEKLDKLFDAKKMIIRAKMSTSKDANGNQVDVKFKSTYKMSVNFGIKAKLKLEVDIKK